MFWLFWKAIIKQSKNIQKDNLNIIHLNNTPTHNWDLNFTETAVMYVKTSWKLSVSSKGKIQGFYVAIWITVLECSSKMKPNLFPVKKECRRKRAYFQDWKIIYNVLYGRAL
jgi:hypothetical protein